MPGYVIGNFFCLFGDQCVYSGAGEHSCAEYCNQLRMEERKASVPGHLYRLLYCSTDLCGVCFRRQYLFAWGVGGNEIYRRCVYPLACRSYCVQPPGWKQWRKISILLEGLHAAIRERKNLSVWHNCPNWICDQLQYSSMGIGSL